MRDYKQNWFHICKDDLYKVFTVTILRKAVKNFTALYFILYMFG